MLFRSYVMVDGDYGSWEMGRVIIYSYKGDDHHTMCNLLQFLVLISLSSARSTALESKNKYNAGDISGNLNIYLGTRIPPTKIYTRTQCELTKKPFYWKSATDSELDELT